MNNNIKSQPLILYIRVTENCNANCFMCGFAKNKKPVYITNDVMDTVIHEAKRIGIQLIRFTGGEPLLHQNLISFITKIHAAKIKTSLITNGFLLPHFAQQLSSSGIDQVIVSLDGSTPKIHDRARNLKGLFSRAIEGITLIKQNKSIITRINTVASPLNITDFKYLLALLIKLEIDQWSIIPVKTPTPIWDQNNIDHILNIYQHFVTMVKNIKKPIFLGYSKRWAGRNKTEILNYFTKGITIRPRGNCNTVKFIRFYNPFLNTITPCNCVVWRPESVKYTTPIGIDAMNNKSLSRYVNYLYRNGNTICRGCEPTNAYLADHPELLKQNIFLF